MWRALQISLLAFVLVNWGNAAYIALKAELAQHLVSRAWAQTLATGDHHYPWPWADSWPVARLSTHSGEDLLILAGAHGTSLAFGPGHLDGSDQPGQGHAVIGGHRDTHFQFLRHAAVGERLKLQQKDGLWRIYRIIERRVVNIHETPLEFLAGEDRLELITCYPFDALVPGGPLRLSVVAIPERLVYTGK